MNNNKRISSSNTSKSSSSASSTSNSPNLQRNLNNNNSNSNPNPNPNPNPRPPTTKTMEEVWQDINFFSLHHHHHRHHPPTVTTASSLDLRGMTLQDFLSRPFSRDPAPASAVLPTVYGPPATPPPPPPPPPPHTFLSLNSGPEHRHFHFLNNPEVASQQIECSFGALGSPPANEKKRFPEPEKFSGDRRRKRMIKNRESAARSRARKQAYTNELELEVAHLLEENAKLKKQQEQLCVAAAAQFPKKNTLHRTSTAPF